MPEPSDAHLPTLDAPAHAFDQTPERKVSGPQKKAGTPQEAVPKTGEEVLRELAHKWVAVGLLLKKIKTEKGVPMGAVEQFQYLTGEAYSASFDRDAWLEKIAKRELGRALSPKRRTQLLAIAETIPEPVSEHPKRRFLTPKRIAQSLLDEKAPQDKTSRDDLPSRYHRAAATGIDRTKNRREKWKARHEFQYLVNKLEQEIHLLPQKTEKERDLKRSLENRLELWKDVDLDWASDTLSRFNELVDRCYEAQHELYKSRTPERITALQVATQNLRREYQRLLTDTQQTAIEYDVSSKELDEGIQRTPLIKTKITFDPTTDEGRVDHSITPIDVAERLAPGIAEAAKFEDVNVIHRLKRSGELKKLNQLVEMFEETSDFEQENLRIKQSPNQEPGVKATYSLDDVNELRRIRGFLSEIPSQKLSLPSKDARPANDNELASGLKTQRELMMASYEAQKKELDEKKKVLLARFGKDRIPKGEELKASIGSWLKDAAKRLFGVRNYVSNDELLKQYREQETQLKRLEEYYQTPEAVVDRHSKVRTFQQNLVHALGVFGDRSTDIQRKQESVELVKEAQEAHAKKNFLPTDSFDMLINAFQKTLPKAVQAMERYQQDIRELAQVQTEKVRELRQDLSRKSLDTEETVKLSAPLVEISEGLNRILVREWEAYAPLPLLKQRRQILEALAQHGQDDKFQQRLKELRSQTKGLNIETYSVALTKSAAWRETSSVEQIALKEVLHMEKRIEALQEAHELENELRHNPLLEKAKRAATKHQKRIDTLYALAYGEIPSRGAYKRAA